MTTLNVEIPHSLHKRLQEVAESEGISIEQFVATAVAEKMSSLMTEVYLEERARHGTREKYEAALDQVQDVEPETYDRLPGS
jgi:hypothetical protein